MCIDLRVNNIFIQLMKSYAIRVHPDEPMYRLV